MLAIIIKKEKGKKQHDNWKGINKPIIISDAIIIENAVDPIKIIREFSNVKFQKSIPFFKLINSQLKNNRKKEIQTCNNIGKALEINESWIKAVQKKMLRFN